MALAYQKASTSTSSSSSGSASAASANASARGSNSSAIDALAVTTGSDPSLATGGEHYEDHGARSTLFVNGVSEDDVIQSGGTGDCYLLAALASMASASPDAITEMVRDEGGGRFSVRFYAFSGDDARAPEAQPVWVASSAVLPTTADGEVAYGHSDAENAAGQQEIWVSVIEKAYAKFIDTDGYYENWYNSVKGRAAEGEEGYDRLFYGNVVHALASLRGAEALYGGEHYEIAGDYNNDEDGHWANLTRCLDAGMAVVVNDQGETVLGFIPVPTGSHHSVSVLDYRAEGGKREVLVRNQQAGDKPLETWYDIGDFCDKFEHWYAIPMPTSCDETESFDVPRANGDKVTRYGFAAAVLAAKEGFTRASPRAVAAAAVKHGLFNGTADAAIDDATADATFRLAEGVNRAEAAKMIVAAWGLPMALPEGKVAWFFDVLDESQWYFTYAHVARRYGIFKGSDGKNEFRPSAGLSSAELDAILSRLPPREEPCEAADQTNGTDAVTDIEEARRLAIPVYPGTSASAEAKFEFFAKLLDRCGYGAQVPSQPGKPMLLAIRGFRPDRLATLAYDNTKNKFNDMFVVLGLDAEGKAVASEFEGSVDPGVAGEYALQEGLYEYAYEGESFSSVTGYTVTGSYFRMKGGTDFDTVHDANRDGAYDLASGDTEYTEPGSNRKYLIHDGGSNLDGDVGLNSVGCQVIAGREADGSKKVNTMHDMLGDEGFTEVLLDGTTVLDALDAASPSQAVA